MPQTTVLCFISGCWLGFKTPNFKEPGKTHSSPPEERLTACPLPFFSRKVVSGQEHCGWGLLWSTLKSCDQVNCSLCMPLSPAPFCPRKTVTQGWSLLCTAKSYHKDICNLCDLYLLLLNDFSIDPGKNFVLEEAKKTLF